MASKSILKRKSRADPKLKTALPSDFPCGQCDDQLYLLRGRTYSYRSSISEIKDTLYPELDEEETPCVLHCRKRNEGFKTSSKVQYVARVGNFIDHGAQYHGALQILKVILSYDYLWQNVRVKGGAYGCMSNFNRIGEGYLISYRDPNLKKTMEVYEARCRLSEEFHSR